jgi:exodeoxyribonuclease-3
MKIATWNVNSIRSRLAHVIDWLEINQPDVLGLQETKVEDAAFPFQAFTGWGVHHVGQKSYNGVALIGKTEGKDVVTGVGDGLLDEHKRVISATYGDVRVINVYAPQGEDVASTKFAFKRSFYAQLTEYLAKDLKKHAHVVLMGDLNIALDERDVYDPKKSAGKCMFTEDEHGWIDTLLALGMVDAFRQVNEESGQFSWWDYRTYGYRPHAGMRIDHVFVSHSLIDYIENVEIFKQERTRDKPSDHVPVMLTLKGM